MRLQVKDFMTSPVITASGEERIKDLRELMQNKGINAIPIVAYANDKLKVDMTIQGIITSTDLNENINEDALVKDVKDLSKVYVVHADSSAQSAAKMMLKKNIHHILVMDDGDIKGMISAFDFVKLVAEHALV